MKRIGYVKHSRLEQVSLQRDQLFRSIKKIARGSSDLFDRTHMQSFVGKDIEIRGVFLRESVGGYDTILVKYPILPSGEIIADHVWVRGVSSIDKKINAVVHIRGSVYMYDGYKYGIMLKEFLQ